MGNADIVGVTGKITFINGEEPQRTVVIERVQSK